MNVPMLDLKLQYASIAEEAEAAVLDVCRSQWCVLGPKVQELEETMAAYCGTNHALGVSSGTDALLMCLMALELNAQDEVILPTYSFFATAGAVVRAGATPVFVDIDPVTFNMRPDAFADAITDNTKAVIPVHLYGQMADMDSIMAIAEEHDITVIEDAAQSLGAVDHKGRKAGSVGHYGCYSFYPTKNLGAFGDAGLVVTNDESRQTHLVQMRNHGMEPRYYHDFVGGNFRIDAIQAAVLNVKAPHLDNWHAARRNNADIYNRAFIEAGLATKTGEIEFSDAERVLLPIDMHYSSQDTNTHIYNQYVIRVQHRDHLRTVLQAAGIGHDVYYPVPFHKQKCFQNIPTAKDRFPVSDDASETSIALPIFPELKEEQLLYVVETIKKEVLG